MKAHKYAGLMADYADDALTTEQPWELWEFRKSGGDWKPCTWHPYWAPYAQFRRKRVKLCYIMGNAIYKGDTVWHADGRELVVEGVLNTCSMFHIHTDQGSFSVSNIRFEKPKKMVDLYKWAVKEGDTDWYETNYYYADEAALREALLLSAGVPADGPVVRIDISKIKVKV